MVWMTVHGAVQSFMSRRSIRQRVRGVTVRSLWSCAVNIAAPYILTLIVFDVIDSAWLGGMGTGFTAP